MLEENIQKQIDVLIERYPQIDKCKKEIEKAYLIFEESYAKGNKLLVAGNGGSAADSEHIVGELMKGFENPRNLSSEYKEKLMSVNNELGKVLGENLQMALPTIALDGHVALTTAYMNDCEPLLCFAQQVNGYGVIGDVFWGISTSGNSKNIKDRMNVSIAINMLVFIITFDFLCVNNVIPVKNIQISPRIVPIDIDTIDNTAPAFVYNTPPKIKQIIAANNDVCLEYEFIFISILLPLFLLTLYNIFYSLINKLCCIDLLYVIM